MSRVKWSRIELTDGSGHWHEYLFADGLGYSVDAFPDPRMFRASFHLPNEDIQIGPARKTLRAAHNDCKRHARRLRAELVKFDRAKLP